MIVAVCGCGRPAPDFGSRASVATIRVTPASVELAVGRTQQFSATLGDAAGNMLPRRMVMPSRVQGPEKQLSNVIGDSKGRTGPIVKWSSDEPAIVRVDARGLLTALTVGSATITATSEGKEATATVVVTAPPTEAPSVAPASATLAAGETLQLAALLQDGSPAPVAWVSDQPSRATVNRSGLVTAISPGIATITATGIERTTAILTITPTTTISGLDFPGNAGASSTIRFEFTSPFSAYPATYIWRAYPRQQQSYYTAFFWGNNGAFYRANTYYGFHPYPDWHTAHQHFWEIAAPPGEDFVSDEHVVFDRWYLQVAVCSVSGTTRVHEFYWDWPNTANVVRHSGARYGDPPMPAVVVGDAPWNQGHEVWDGVLRGFQFYDVALTHSEIAREIASPGSVRTPWYLNVNPTPDDVSDKSGNGHSPAWVGSERPSLWTGSVNGGSIRTVVPPR